MSLGPVLLQPSGHPFSPASGDLSLSTTPNTELVRLCYKLMAAGETEQLLALLAPAAEWIQPEGLSPYGLGGTRIGPAGARLFLNRMPRVFDEYRAVPGQYVETSDNGVLVLGTRHVRAPGGQARTVPFTHLWRIADGRISRFEEQFDTGPVLGALRAVGSTSDVRRDAGAKAPDPDRFIQLGLGFWPAKVMLSALELGVYESLSGAPADAATLAARLGLHERGARDFFDSQVALGILEREDGVYRNTPDAEMFLDPAKDSYIGGLLEMAGEQWYASWGRLTTALRTGEPQNNLGGDGGDPFAALYADPELTRRFQKAMTGGSMAAAGALARTFPWERHSVVADIGCSEGILLSTVLRENPHLTGVGFDLPQVAPIFEEHSAHHGLGERVAFAPGNFHADPLPRADVIVFGRILHDWDLETKRMLLAKAYAALPPGGAVVVYESMIDDDRRSNAFGLLTSLHMLLESPGGFDYSGADCVGWMREAGFQGCGARPLDGPVSVVIGYK